MDGSSDGSGGILDVSILDNIYFYPLGYQIVISHIRKFILTISLSPNLLFGE